MEIRGFKLEQTKFLTRSKSREQKAKQVNWGSRYLPAPQVSICSTAPSLIYIGAQMRPSQIRGCGPCWGFHAWPHSTCTLWIPALRMVLPESYTFWVQCFHTLECGTRGSQIAVQREVPNYFPCGAMPETMLVAPCPQANALYRK